MSPSLTPILVYINNNMSPQQLWKVLWNFFFGPVDIEISLEMLDLSLVHGGPAGFGSKITRAFIVLTVDWYFLTS